MRDRCGFLLTTQHIGIIGVIISHTTTIVVLCGCLTDTIGRFRAEEFTMLLAVLPVTMCGDFIERQKVDITGLCIPEGIRD